MAPAEVDALWQVWGRRARACMRTNACMRVGSWWALRCVAAVLCGPWCGVPRCEAHGVASQGVRPMA
eukprot:366208-Chlamydomonas_euryale.AAC.7